MDEVVTNEELRRRIILAIRDPPPPRHLVLPDVLVI
jgi:hypothetical protein